MNYEYSTTHLTDNRALFNSTKFMAFSSAKDCRRNIGIETRCGVRDLLFLIF